MAGRGNAQDLALSPLPHATDLTIVYPVPLDWGNAQLPAEEGGGGAVVPTTGQIWPRAYPT